ncbi:RE1 [Symbiodinium sp. KB8]|nr:RE1 [Symbiodinium sp. KB8]
MQEIKELDPKSAKMFKECVGRLLYLAHSQPDIQMAVCVLSSRMAHPTTGAKKQLFRVIGYLAGAPDLGFLIKPIVPGARLKWPGNDCTTEVPIYEVESVTDADWAGCKRSRRSRTSIQLYVGGGLVGSMVRSQRSIALSSAESEYLALVSGACEATYLVDVLRFLVREEAEVRLTCLTDSAACRGICQRLGAGRVRHLQCAVLWVQQAVRRQLRIGTISGSDNPADIGTKPLGGGRIRELLWTMGCLEADGSEYGLEDYEAAQQKKAMATALKEMKNGGHKVNNVKAILPLVLLLSQVGAIQGLGLAAAAQKPDGDEWLATIAVTVGLGIFLLALVYGIPWGVLRLLKWSLRVFLDQGKGKQKRREKSVQANLGMSRKEERFTNEYVDRCTEMRQVISEQRAELDEFEKLVRKLRAENAELRRAQRPTVQVPPEIAVTARKGERYHRPTCGNVKRPEFKVYTPCMANGQYHVTKVRNAFFKDKYMEWLPHVPVIIRGRRRNGNPYESHDYLPVTTLELGLSRQKNAWSDAQVARNVNEAALRQMGQPGPNDPIYMMSREVCVDSQIRLRQPLQALREVSYQFFAGDQILASAFEERRDMLCVPCRCVCPAEIRTFWRNAPMFYVDCRGRVLTASSQRRSRRRL